MALGGGARQRTPAQPATVVARRTFDVDVRNHVLFVLDAKVCPDVHRPLFAGIKVVLGWSGREGVRKKNEGRRKGRRKVGDQRHTLGGKRRRNGAGRMRHTPGGQRRRNVAGRMGRGGDVAEEGSPSPPRHYRHGRRPAANSTPAGSAMSGGRTMNLVFISALKRCGNRARGTARGSGDTSRLIVASRGKKIRRLLKSTMLA